MGIASRFAFCVITQMYFASYAARGAATPVQSYAVGWLFVHVGDLLGLLVSFPLQDAIGASVIEPSGAAAVLIVALVAAVMLALNDETRFCPGKHPSLMRVRFARRRLRRRAWMRQWAPVRARQRALVQPWTSARWMPRAQLAKRRPDT